MPVAQNRLCAAAHERFWRTLREDCVDHLSADVTLHDVNTRLLAFLDRTNHLDPRSSLLGASPGQRWVERPQRPEVTDDELLAALVVDVLRRVSNTWTVSVAGIDWDRVRLDATATPWVEYDSRRLSLHRVEAKGNASRRRETHTGNRSDTIPVDPELPLVDKMEG